MTRLLAGFGRSRDARVAALEAEVAELRQAMQAQALAMQALSARLAPETLEAMLARSSTAVARRTLPGGSPNLDPAHLALRDTAQLRRDVKVLGSRIAERLWAEAVKRESVPAQPVRAKLGGRICRQADIESPWLRHWAAETRMVPIYHRKVWEIGYVLQAIWESGLMRDGTEALGFAVGQEPIPALLASRGVRVLATDLQSDDPRALAWSLTSQNASAIATLRRPDILPDAVLEARCRFRPVDMTAIPDDLTGRFDIVWSTCSLEHLGSIAAGLRFIEEAMRCLKPGGIAVHTTELNLEPGDETVDNWPTVLFRPADLEACAARLAAMGHQVLPIDFSPGTGVLDGFVDVPPYGDGPLWPARPPQPHLRLSVDGFAATSVGMIVRAGG